MKRDVDNLITFYFCTPVSYEPNIVKILQSNSSYLVYSKQRIRTLLSFIFYLFFYVTDCIQYEYFICCHAKESGNEKL